MKDDQPGQRTVIEHLARTFARGLVIAGGSFWLIATFGVPLVYHGTSTIDASVGMWPFLAVLVILIIGWKYERLAAVLIAPMGLAAVLFTLPARAEERRHAAADKQEPAA